MRPRALFVLPGFAGNGITRSILDLADELGKNGVEASIFILGPVLTGEIPHGGVPTVEVIAGDIEGGRRRVLKMPTAAARLLRRARRSNVVVAAWEVGEPLVAAILAGTLARRPVVTMAQAYAPAELDHYYTDWQVRATKRCYARSDAVVCGSEGLVEVAESMGVPRERISVVRSGVDIERTTALAGDPPPDWVPEAPFLVGLGRLATHKGFDLLIRAHAEVLAQGLDHRVVIIGQGECEAELKALAAEVGVSESVLFPGYMTNPFPVVARCAAMCAPSRFEGWGRMVAEALAIGVPVIAADIAGPASILEGGRYGDLVQPESVASLSEAIERHLRDPERLDAKAAEARNNPDSFSLPARGRGIADVIRALAS